MTAHTLHRLAAAPAWLLPAASAAAAAAGCTVLALVDPSQPGRYPLCPFLALTGRFCPGCGTLRGLHQLLNGNVVAAAGFNVLMLAALPFVVYTWLAWASPRVGGPTLPPWRVGLRGTQVVLVAVLAFWLLRNLPVAPLTLLAP